MIRKYVLPLMALGLFLFAVLHVVRGQQQPPPVSPPVTPPGSPFGKTVAGAGIVEAQTENVAVGSALPGVVEEVFAVVGRKVRPGDPLFRLDDRAQRAQAKVREADLAAARAQLTKLEEMPRPEELPAGEARVREAQANLTDAEDQWQRVRRLNGTHAVSAEEVTRREMAYKAAREQLARARADYDLLRAGSWEPDRAIARAAVAQAQAQLDQAKTDLERLTVRAPLAGEVMQVNVRPGEYVGTPPGQALVMLGNLQRLHVRVDVDEHDIPRYRPGTPARATLRGDPGQSYPLTFVRVEPYVIPKRSLTGSNTERVDTRVLQVIYALDDGDKPVYVGQQVDVFIDVNESY